MLGESAPWSPWRHLREHHPHVRVHGVELPRGYLGCTDLAGHTVWLDSRLTQAERRCTLAHEIGHLELDLPCTRRNDAGERLVDEWAARRLIDGRSLARAFQWSLHLAEIAEELWVDLPMLRARLRCMTDEEQDAVMAAIERARAA